MSEKLSEEWGKLIHRESKEVGIVGTPKYCSKHYLKHYLPTSFLVVFVLLCINTVCFSLDEHFVGLWLFDEGSGKTASDSSNYRNHGKIEGGAEWVDDGKFGKALSFNGTDAYVEVSSSDSLKIADQITIEFWLLPRSFAGEWNIVRKHTQDTYDYEINAIGDIHFNLKFAETQTGVVVGGNDVPFDEWTHLAFTYDGKKALMYINGDPVFEQDIAGAIPTSDSPLYIGCRDTTRRFIDGALDEFCLSNIARTADEIKSHIEKGLASELAIEKAGKLAITWAALKRE